MSDLEHLTQIVDTCLSTNNEARNNSEALMKNLRQQDINQYIFSFLNLLKASNRADVQVFCIVHLRRVLSDFVESGEGRWDELHPDTQKLFKEVLIELLKSDPHASIRNVLCDTIGDMAATMECLSEERRKNCTQEATEWAGLMQTLWGLLNSSNVKLMESALKIMGVLFVHCGQNYSNFKDELLPLFRLTITHSNNNVAVAAIETFSCYLENSEFKKAQIFLELIPMILAKIVELSLQDEELTFQALGAVADLLDTEPKMMKKDLRLFIKSVKQMVESKISEKLKSNTIENLILSFERLPKTYKANEEAVKEGIEVIFLFMVASDRNADGEWLDPPDGYNFAESDDDNPESVLRFGMAGFDRIIKVLPRKLILPILSRTIMEMVAINDWRYQHCALMSLSQVGEYIDDLTEFDPIVQFTLNFLQNEHPKVRYAAIHCIGQMADDCKPAFQDRYGKDVLPAMLNLYNDRVPRIVHHTVSAVANFMDQCPKHIIQNHVTEILEPTIHLVENGKSYFKEASLLLLGTLAEACGTDFIPLWEKTADAVFTLLNSTKKEYKVLKGNAIESLSLIGQAVGREEFKKVCRPVIEKMLEIQNEVSKEDTQSSFLMSGWHRIAAALEEDFVPYLEMTMPPVLKLVEDILSNEHEKAKKALEDDNDGAIVAEVIKGMKKEGGNKLFWNVNTSESDEVVVAVQMMKGFADTLKAGYLPYAEKTSEILTHLIENSENEDVRISAAAVFPCLIEAVNSSNNQSKIDIIKKLNATYLEILWRAIWQERDPEIMRKFVNIMIEVIQKAGTCMDEKELTLFNTCVLRTLKLSEERRSNNEKYLSKQEDGEEDYEDDDDEDDILEETNKLEEELHIALADLVGAVFKVYKGSSLPLVKLVYKEILPKVLLPEAPVSLSKFGLFLIDDIIEYVGIELIPEEWPSMVEALLKYGVHPHIHLRHAAIFGIGCLGDKSKDTFGRMADMCMSVLYQGLQMEKLAKDDADEFGSSRDNIIASLGKIIKSQSTHIDVKNAAKVWVSNLPLRYDFIEGKVQHELLVDIILESDAALVFGDSGENLPKIIAILAEVLETRGASEGFDKKVARVVQFLAGSEATKGLLQDALGKLDEKSQAKLKKAVEGQ